MKDTLVAVTAVGLIGFAQAGEPAFYRQCEDLVVPPVGKNQVHELIQACVNYYRYGWQRGWLPTQILENKTAESGQSGQAGQGGDGGAGGSLPGLSGGAGGAGGNAYLPHETEFSGNGYYGYKYCEELIGPPHGPRDDYTYGLLEDCVAYYRYNWRHGYPIYAMGSPPPQPGQPGEPGRGGEGGAGGAGGSLPGLSGGEAGDGGHHSARRSARPGHDGADGDSYGSGIGGEGGNAGRGIGGGSGGDGGAASTGGIGGAGGAGGSTD